MKTCCPATSNADPACNTVQDAPSGALDCCNFYAQGWVRDLFADYFHPGGAALSARTIDVMKLSPGQCVADLGCGSGSTSLLLAQDYQLQVTGIDMSQANLDYAVRRARDQGIPLLDQADTVNDAMPTSESMVTAGLRFVCADACHLPLIDQYLDGVLCECTLSLFPQQERTLAEIYRCLKPGGSLGVTDMALSDDVSGGGLAEDLKAVIGPWACLNGALSESGYRSLFAKTGFTLQECDDESQTLLELLEGVKRRLLVLAAGQSLGMLQNTDMPKLDMAQIRHYLQRAREEVVAGRIRYLRFHLSKPK